MLCVACQTAVMLMKSVAVAFVGLLLSCGVAQADKLDDQYLALLSSHGVEGDPGVLIANGRASCDALDQSRTGLKPTAYQMALLRIDFDLKGQGLSDQQVAQVVQDGNQIYCPGKA